MQLAGRLSAEASRAALGQVPAVTERAGAAVASRTKRAKFKAMVKTSFKHAALALLGKPNQGERSRWRRL